MWQPEPGWEAMPGGRGALTVGHWRVRGAGGPFVVKRVRRPGPDELGHLDPDGSAYWRREAEVALAHEGFRGLVWPVSVHLEEDDEGYSLWMREVDGPAPTALFTTVALARFSACAAPSEISHGAGSLLSDRLRLMEAHEGWPTLARTTFADPAHELWQRRGRFLRRYAELPQLPAHGDVVPANLVGTRGEDVIAVDWGTFGLAPRGADLGYFALSCREEFEVLLGSYLDVPGPRDESPDDVRFAAEAMAVYTVVARAEWALSRVAPGEGPLAAKYRHPSVAPHLRALQRAFPQVESLLNR